MSSRQVIVECSSTRSIPVSVETPVGALVAGFGSWPVRRWAVAVGASIVFALLAGIPTDVIANPWASRVVPVQWWSYPILASTALLAGLVTATYVRSPVQSTSVGKVTGGGLLSALAIGCPVCNKLVVLIIGTTGALSVWAPLQPLLGVASMGCSGGPCAPGSLPSSAAHCRGADSGRCRRGRCGPVDVLVGGPTWPQGPGSQRVRPVPAVRTVFQEVRLAGSRGVAPHST
jgi:hypothetical protein